MSEQVQALIDKIKTEGIQTAEQKSRQIEDDARQRAQKIIEDAKKEAAQLIASSKREVEKFQNTTQLALRQASRDTLLSLRKQIENILKKIITRHVADSLTPERLGEILQTVIQKSMDEKSAVMDIQVLVGQESFEKLKNGFVTKLQKELKDKPIRLESSADAGQGLTISFDNGRSSFDFSDQALAEYLSLYVNPQVSAFIKDTTSS